MQADSDLSGEIEFQEFCKVIERHKSMQPESDEADMLDAFVALGGNVCRLHTDHVSSWSARMCHAWPQYSHDQSDLPVQLAEGASSQFARLTCGTPLSLMQPDKTGKISTEKLRATIKVGIVIHQPLAYLSHL